MLLLTTADLVPETHVNGLAAYYDYGCVESCGCMNYLSGPRELPR